MRQRVSATSSGRSYLPRRSLLPLCIVLLIGGIFLALCYYALSRHPRLHAVAAVRASVSVCDASSLPPLDSAAHDDSANELSWPVRSLLDWHSTGVGDKNAALKSSRGFPDSGPKSASFLGADAAMRSSVRTTQFPPASECRHRKLLLLQYPSIGLSSALGYIAAAYMHATARGRVLVFDDRNAWNYGGTWDCFFEKLSSCSLSDGIITDSEWDAEASWPSLSDYAEGDLDAEAKEGQYALPPLYRSLRPTATPSTPPSWWKRIYNALSPFSSSPSTQSPRLGNAKAKAGQHALPPQYPSSRPAATPSSSWWKRISSAISPFSSSSKSPRIVTMGLGDSSFFHHDSLQLTIPVSREGREVGTAYWRTLFMAAVMRPNARMVAEMAKLLKASSASLDLPPPTATTPTMAKQRNTGQLSAVKDSPAPYLSWHIRQGDKVNEGFALFGPEETFPAILDLSKSTGLTHVFIASDDPRAVDAARALVMSAGLVPHSLSYMSALEEAQEAASVARTSASLALALAADAVANLWLLSGGNRQVGLFHSNFCRYSAELMFARGRAQGPFVWVDADECDLLHTVSSTQHGFHPDRDGYFNNLQGGKYLAWAASEGKGAL